MKLSGYSFIHNGINGGYPFVEAIKAIQPYVDEIVIVDMESDDGTRDILNQLNVKIIAGKWGNEAGETLRQAHSQYHLCEGDVIIHFEADEVYDDGLIREIINRLRFNPNQQNLSVYRLQVEQNFQRIRWYPELVHRVFPRNSDTTKEGHTTNKRYQTEPITENGFLWDCTNCFRDNYLQRIKQQAELWHGKINYTFTPLHTRHNAELDYIGIEEELRDKRWVWTETPLAIPKILRSLVGVTKYNPMLNLNSEV